MNYLAPAGQNTVSTLFIRRVLLREFTTQSVLAAIERLLSWKQPNVSGVEWLADQLELICKVCATVRQETPPPKGPFDVLLYRCNLLLDSLVEFVALQLPAQTEQSVKTICSALEAAHARAAYRGSRWALEQLSRMLKQRIDRVALLEKQMPTDEEMTRLLADFGGEISDDLITNYAAAIAKGRRYGVKSCAFEPGPLDGPQQAWVFSDPHAFMNELPQDAAAWPSALAFTALGRRKEIKTTTAIEWEFKSNTFFGFPFPLRMKAVVLASGDFTIDGPLGVVSLRHYFELADRRKAYNLFRLLQLHRLDNLISRTTQQEAGKSAVQFKEGDKVEASRPLKECLTLALCRVQRMHAERSGTRAQSGRQLAAHEVVGHLRRISGSPGLEARQRALEEAGINLPQGYTWVSGHRRGQGLETTRAVHVAVVR